MSLLLTGGVVAASQMINIKNAIHQATLTVENTGDAVNNKTIEFVIDGTNLVNTNFMNDNALNSAILLNGAGVPQMPPSPDEVPQVWRTFTPRLDRNEIINYTLYLGGTSDMHTSHQVFPGTYGVATPDNAAMEPGADFVLVIDGNFDIRTADKSAHITTHDTALVMKNRSFKIVATADSVGVVPSNEISFSVCENPSSFKCAATGNLIISADKRESMFVLMNSGDSTFALGQSRTGDMGTLAASPIPDYGDPWRWVNMEAPGSSGGYYINRIMMYQSSTGDWTRVYSTADGWDGLYTAVAHSEDYETSGDGVILSGDKVKGAVYPDGAHMIDLGGIDSLSFSYLAYDATIPENAALWFSVNSGDKPNGTSGNGCGDTVFDAAKETAMINGAELPGILFATGDNLSGGCLRFSLHMTRLSTADESPTLHSLMVGVARSGDAVVHYELNTRATGTLTTGSLPDRSGSGNPGTFYWQGFDLGAQLIRTADSFQPVEPDQPVSTTAPSAADVITSTGDNFFGGATSADMTSLPFASLLQDAAKLGCRNTVAEPNKCDNSGIPTIALWMILFGTLTVVFGAVAMFLFKNLVYAGIVMGFLILLFSLLSVGIFPLWVVIVFGIIASGVVLLLKQGQIVA
jgi:hypothetical protein